MPYIILVWGGWGCSSVLSMVADNNVDCNYPIAFLALGIAMVTLAYTVPYTLKSLIFTGPNLVHFSELRKN